jgi:putative Ca2+/H+ antiporter (TMEM165/GDT1 family)
MWLGKAIAPHGQLYQILPRLLAVACSLAIVGFGAAIALRISRLHALVVGLVLATAFELIYFSARTLSETFAVALLVPAAWLLLPHPERSPQRLAIGGLLVGLCFATRFQLAPALVVLVAGCCRADLRAWALVAAGGLGGLAIDGVVDALHGLVPFDWMVENVRLNVVENRSADYGVLPFQWFLTFWLRLWGLMALPVILLGGIGARRQPVLLGVALVNLLAHSLIAHKEYRFVFLSEMLLILLAAIGTGDAIRWALARRPHWRPAIAGGAILFWLCCSASVALSPAGRDVWNSNRRAIRMMRVARDVPGSCGLAYFQPEPDRLASYYYYDRPARIYFFGGDAAFDDVRRNRAAFNVVVTSPDRAWQLAPAYKPLGCFGSGHGAADLPPLENRCVFARQGGCTPLATHTFDINEALRRRGE